MSGHSKWSTIKRQKGAADQKRGMTFTKVANAITIAAKQGNSGDPDANSRLRLALEQARDVNMPKENIQRAIDRGLGRLPGQNLEEIVYEGFGPGKAAFLIEAVTDNKLRTLQEIRYLFERSGGSLGGSGSTSYIFDKKGEIRVGSRGGGLDEEMMELIDAGADDIEDLTTDEGAIEYLIYVHLADLGQLSKIITQKGYTIKSSGISLKPNTIVEIADQATAKSVLDFTEKLENHDDVQKVYANFDITDDVLEIESS